MRKFVCKVNENQVLTAEARSVAAQVGADAVVVAGMTARGHGAGSAFQPAARVTGTRGEASPVEFVLPPHPGHELRFDLLLGALGGADCAMASHTT